MLVERYAVPIGVASAELVIKNSRFIGTVGRAHDATAAREFVAHVRQMHPDASHNAWAYRLHEGPQGDFAFSDDGEPGGTAGRPMLAVLEGSGLCEVAAVGTRYFGGIKLGTGGLVRAYSACVREALARVSRLDMVLHHTVRITVDYSAYGPLSYQLPRLGVKLEETDFAERVTFTLAAPEHALAQVATVVQEETGGKTIISSWSGYRYDPAN